jgi:hypothetical protein
MKEIKLTGREKAVIKAIDPTMGSIGSDILERTKLEEDELLDLLNGLTDVGYVEAYTAAGSPIQVHVTPDRFAGTRYEVNPSYALQLREALRR